MQMNSGFHGSMLHVLEYAEYFIQKNADVHIGSVFISEENRKIAEDRGIHVHSLRELPVDTKYDLVFALHLPLHGLQGLEIRSRHSSDLVGFFACGKSSSLPILVLF